MKAHCRLPATILGGPVPASDHHPIAAQCLLPVTVRWRLHCRLPTTIRGGPVPASGYRAQSGHCWLPSTGKHPMTAHCRLPVTVRWRFHCRLPTTIRGGPVPASGHRATSGDGAQPKSGYQIPVTDECKIRLSSTALVRRPCSKANTVNHLYCWRWQPVWKQFSDRDNNFTKCLWEKRNQCCWTERRANFIVSSNM